VGKKGKLGEEGIVTKSIADRRSKKSKTEEKFPLP